MTVFRAAPSAAFLGRRWQRSQASGAPHSATGTGKRRLRRILPPAPSGVGRAGLCPAAADAGEGRR
jgi:hypothetical protein